MREWRPHVVHFNNTPSCHLPALMLCRYIRLPFTLHLRDTVLLTRSERWSLDAAHAVIALSNAARTHYDRQGVSRREDLYDSVNTGQFDEAAREAVDLPTSRWIIALAGSLVSRKRQSMAIQAVEVLAREFPEALLVLLGEGPDRAAIEEEITSAGSQPER